MAKTEKELFEGIYALPSFPIVLVTVDRNIMTAVAFHFYSFDPPCLMVGIRPENLTFELISEKGEFVINIPTKEQLDIVRVCGSTSGRTEDKFVKAGLTPQKGKMIDSFLIMECPVNIECVVVHHVQFEGSHSRGKNPFPLFTNIFNKFPQKRGFLKLLSYIKKSDAGDVNKKRTF